MSTYRAQFPLPSAPLEGLCINFTSVPGSFGVIPQEMALLWQGGFRWARQWVYRTDVQDASGQFSWAELDQFVNDLTGAGFRLILNLVDSFASGNTPAITSEADLARFGDFCAAMARRYAGLGVVFEIWNEPDADSTWFGGDPSGSEYAAMAMVACGSIRAAVGEDGYIAGPACDVRSASFVQTCLSAGLGSYWDLCTVHTYRYTVPAESIRPELRVIKDLISSVPRNIRVAISEVGYSSTTFDHSPDRIIPGTDYIPTTACSSGSVTGATNASPIVITTSANHGLPTGATVTVAGISGNTAANNTWVIENTGAKTFSLIGSAGNGSSGSGTWTGMVGKNLAQWSEDLHNGVWIADFGDFEKTRCPAPSSLPAGTVAWNLSRAGGTGTFGIRQSTGGVTLKGGNTYTVSAWMRCVSGTHGVYLNMNDLGGAGETAWDEKFILTPEWMRYEHSFPLTVNHTEKLRIVSTGSDGTSDIQVCQLQCELQCVGKVISDAGFRAAQLRGQAEHLIRQYEAALDEGVYFFGVYTVRDFTADAASSGSAGVLHLGILDYYGVPKPSYLAFQKLYRARSR